MTLVPLLAQVAPGRIERNDKCNFLDSQPALDALLALNCVANVFESLEVDEPVEFVFRGKSRTGSSLVLADPSHEIVGNAYVQSP